MKKSPLLLLPLGGALLFVVCAVGIFRLNTELDDRLSKDWFAPPVEFYYPTIQLRASDRIDLQELLDKLTAHGFRERGPTEPLQKKDFSLIPVDQCRDELSELHLEDLSSCLRLRDAEGTLDSLVWNGEENFFFQGENFTPVAALSMEPELIGEFQGGQPLKSRKVRLPEVPLLCLQAVTAIEDDQFLNHSGVSPSGMMRALMRNLIAGRFAQGGSTITQQLVKNYFLTQEKTLKRKITEQVLAVLLETKLTKDQILEKYLNVIYMGQEGPYQILGLGSAADHYFGKSVSSLNLSECALLAALINNPGRYNPLRHPENAQKRRALVLHKMAELHLISAEEGEQAETASLPEKENQQAEPSAPYFLELAYNELVSLNLPEGRGFRVLTSLTPRDQVALEQGTADQLARVRARRKAGENVEVAALRIHLPTYEITSLTGGSNFRTAPYNRALRAERQIGSIIKPFIYWQVFKTKKPWDQITDEPFTWKFDGRDWTPRNYEKNYSGPVFLFEALTRSLNIPAAKLAQEVGLDALIDTLTSAGLERKVQKLPSLALGALELTPFEVAQMYSTLGNMGRFKNISGLLQVKDLDGRILYEKSNVPGEQRLDPQVTATLISTLKLSPQIGTAQSLRYFLPDTRFIAGKTGTTNDLKDSWFMGLTPNYLMVVWVGRDDNQPSGLTGASGALPIWGAIEKRLGPSDLFHDFHWPQDTETVVKEGHEFVVKKEGWF
jgi:penicillin-binding protein 1B